MVDHTFKRAKYTLSLVFTLIFFSIVVVSYVDSITCPMILQLATEGSLASSILVGGGGGHDAPLSSLASAGGQLANDINNKNNNNNNNKDGLMQQQRSVFSKGRKQKSLKGTTLMSRFLRIPRSVFDHTYSYFPCNVQDLLLQIYMVWFIVFMLHKWIIYKKEGWHYFMLDYCYFHNLIMIFMLLSAVLSVDIHTEDGQVRNHRYESNQYKSVLSAKTAEGGSTASDGLLSTKNGGGVPVRSSPPEAFLDETLPTYWEVIRGMVYDGAESAVTLNVFRFYVGDPLRALVPLAAEAFVSSWDELTSGTEKQLLEKGTDDEDTQNTSSGSSTVHCRHRSISRAVGLAYRLDEMLAPYSSAPTEFVVPPPSKLSAVEKKKDDCANSDDGEEEQFIPTVRIRIAPARYALSSMPPLSQIRFVVIFVMFLGGTFGPILGAIVVWQNALLFHSFDKMTACYLHLAPALVQIVIMSAVYETADMVKHLQGIFEAATEGLLPHQMPRMPSIMMQHQPFPPPPHSHGESTPAYFTPIDTKSIFSHYLTLPNLLLSHVAFFCLWQIFYHVTFGLMAVRRERKFAKKMLKEKREVRTFGTCGTNPTARVTAYTWMMENPPGGKNGLRYRFVCLFGRGETPTKIMFSVVQLLFHIVYILASLPALYVALKWREEPSWLLPYLSIFLVVAINNSANVMWKWISKLEGAAAVSPPPPPPSAASEATESRNAKKLEGKLKNSKREARGK